MGGCGCGGCGGWMWNFIFVFLFFVSCGMGGGFLVGRWVVGFVMTVGIVVADSAENSWIEKERDRGERDKERKKE